jgi:hypothetical protein
MKLKKLLVCMLVLLVLAAGAAFASHRVVNDPNDTPGALDIKKVTSFGLHNPARKIITFKGWTTRSMWDEGSFLVLYDSALDDRFDFYILVRSTGTRMEATLWRDYKEAPDELVGDAQVWRPNTRSVVTRISLDQLWFSKGRDFYRWKVQSLKWTGPNCKNVCFDKAPNGKAVKEPKPAEQN